MRASTVLAVIFVPLILGALLPLAVPNLSKALTSTFNEKIVCEAVEAASKRGFLDAAKARTLFDEAQKAPGFDAKTRETLQRARGECVVKS